MAGVSTRTAAAAVALGASVLGYAAAGSSLSHVESPQSCQVLHAGVGNKNAVKSFQMGVSNKTPEFLKMNPLCKVPVLETPEGPLFESNAIARHVLRLRPNKLLGTPLMGQGELMEPEFYKIGFLRNVRAYGVHFKEGPNGVGVFSARDLPFLLKPRMIMEIPLELMITVSKYPPWLFFPNIVPIGHPVFEIINATDAEVDWDIRLATLLLLAMDKKGEFWDLYSDYLPEVPESTDLLHASEEELAELQDEKFAQEMLEAQNRAEETWEKYWTPDMILKVKRLARTSEKFKWALSIAQTRCITMTMGVGTKIQEANMLIPYADMLNHSFAPTCSLHWRTKDRMLEVLVNAGQSIKEGDEMTLNYLDRAPDREYMRLYGLSSAVNPWNPLSLSGKSKIHLDSFLSAFNITGLRDDYFFDEAVAQRKDNFIDGSVLAMARFLPTWSEGDLPFLPSEERQAVKDLLKECRLQLASFPTTVDHDIKLLAAGGSNRSLRWKAIIKYRTDRKLIHKKIISALGLYLMRILY